MTSIASIMSSLLTPRFWRNATMENPAVSLQDPAAWDAYFGGGMTSDAGIKVSHEGALKVPTFWGIVSMISGDVAMLPAHVFRRLPEDDREIDYDHAAGVGGEFRGIGRLYGRI